MSISIKYARAYLHAPAGPGQTQRRPIGYLSQYGDILRVSFDEAYVNDPDRPILSLAYQGKTDAQTREILTATRDTRVARSDGHWPAYFMNLLPEAHNRVRLARERHCSEEDEFELLAAAGHDLMGGLEIEPVPPQEGIPDTVRHWHTALGLDVLEPGFVEFPLEDGAAIPGVVDKFSAIKDGRRYVVKRHGQAGSFILKLPSTRHPDLVENEFTGYRLAGALELNCATAQIISRADADLPEQVEFQRILAVERFDRVLGPVEPGSEVRHIHRIHFEEFCQALNYEPKRKYGKSIQQDFGAIVGVLEQLSGSPVEDLTEFVARFVAFILMGNCDAHLKNWGLLYADGRTPRLAPLYDPVSVASFFAEVGEDQYGLNRAVDAKLSAFTMQDLEDMLKSGGLNARRITQLKRASRVAILAAKAKWPAILADAPDNVRLEVTRRLNGGVALAQL